ncbi:hypothetical protein [Diplocloster agilis]|nr:hypothetical protein [Diplocloster agilis]
MHTIKAILFSITGVILCILTCGRAFANEPEMNEQSAGMSVEAGVKALCNEPCLSESGEPADTASDFGAFAAWMKSHARTGGKLKLTGDLVVEGNWMFTGWYSDPLPICEIDAGDHTIYVGEGQSLTLNPYVSVSGLGGGNGIFHVEKGGRLELFSIAVNAADGYAVYQEEGSVFTYGSMHMPGTPDFSWEGGIHFAEKPVVSSQGTIKAPENIPVVVVQKGEQPDYGLLPTIDPVTWNYQGKEEKRDIPVLWDTKTQEEALACGERCVLTGSHGSEVVTFEAPVCIVAFQQEGCPVFLNGWVSRSLRGKILNVNLNFNLHDPDSGYRLEYSYDGREWEEIADADIHQDLTHVNFFWEPDMELETLYFSLTEQTEAGTKYSDIAVLDKSSSLLKGDALGGRGGETLPGDPDDATLPPAGTIEPSPDPTAPPGPAVTGPSPEIQAPVTPPASSVPPVSAVPPASPAPPVSAVPPVSPAPPVSAVPPVSSTPDASAEPNPTAAPEQPDADASPSIRKKKGEGKVGAAAWPSDKEEPEGTDDGGAVLDAADETTLRSAEPEDKRSPEESAQTSEKPDQHEGGREDETSGTVKRAVQVAAGSIAVLAILWGIPAFIRKRWRKLFHKRSS